MKMNCSSSGWMVGVFCFPDVRSNFGLKEGRLQSVSEAAFWGSAIMFIVDELVVDGAPRVVLNWPLSPMS